MESFDIVDALINLGVDERTAEDLKSRLHGDDFITLVNALNTDDLASAYQEAGAILRKYNVQLGGSKPVNDYESAKNEALRNGKLFAVEEFINEWLAPVSATGLEGRRLVDEGFNYALEINEQNMDRVLDWLDENQVEYQASSPSLFHIKCGDRASAYKVSRALSEIMSKAVVRDSAANEVEPMSEKKSSVNRRIERAKDKMATISPKDPNLDSIIGRSGSGVHKAGKNPRKDSIRGTKHKGRADESYQIGDDVIVGEQQGKVKIPYGPNGTIGVILDGELAMVAEGDVSRLDEGVIGMTSLNPLFRLRELAGLAPAPMQSPEDVLSGPDDLAVGSGTDVADLPAGDDFGDFDDPAVEPALDPMGDEPAIDPMATPDMAPAGDDPLAGIDDFGPAAGVPGDLPPLPAEPALGVGAPMQSDAMMQIEDSLNGIQTKLSDIRLGEYKTLVKKLQDLTNQVQSMGRDYLGERRKK